MNEIDHYAISGSTARLLDMTGVPEGACGLDDRLKLLNPVTMEAIAGPVVTDGVATEAEVNHLIGALYTEARDPRRLTSLPRIVQCWAREP